MLTKDAAEVRSIDMRGIDELDTDNRAIASQIQYHTMAKRRAAGNDGWCAAMDVGRKRPSVTKTDFKVG